MRNAIVFFKENGFTSRFKHKTIGRQQTFLGGTRGLFSGSSPPLNYTDRAIIVHVNLDFLVPVQSWPDWRYLRPIEVAASMRPEQVFYQFAIGLPQSIARCYCRFRYEVLITRGFPALADNSPPESLLLEVFGTVDTNYRARWCLRLCKAHS